MKGRRLAVFVVVALVALVAPARAATPTLTVTPSSGYLGSRITIVGTHLAKRAHVTVSIGTHTYPATTNRKGKVSVTELVRDVAPTVAIGISGAPSTTFTETAAPTATTWGPGTTWDYPIGTTNYDFNNDAQAIGLDWEDTGPDTVDLLHARNARVICYVSAGSFENWRSDAQDYRDNVTLGSPLDGWPGERWVDVTDPDLQPILEARMQVCKDKGFDAIDFDNVEAYNNHPGLPQDDYDAQIGFNEWLADTTRAVPYSLKVGLKNDLDQIPTLVTHFDFAINEQCHQYHECDALDPFVDAGKAVFNVEYSQDLTPAVCAKFGSSTIKKKLKLDAYRRACP